MTRRFTNADDLEIIRLKKLGNSPTGIGVALNRCKDSIRSRLVVLEARGAVPTAAPRDPIGFDHAREATMLRKITKAGGFPTAVTVNGAAVWVYPFKKAA